MVLGAAYFWYLNAEPFPPVAARAIPILWLGAAAYGARVAILEAGRGAGRGGPGLALALSVPNLLFAALFAMAAVMGG